MNAAIFKKLGRTGALAWITSVGALSGVGGGFAGEAIQFSNPKSTPTPGVKSKVAESTSPALQRLPSVSPYDSIVPSAFPRESMRPRDPKEEKRAKNAKLERENWAVLDEGELQAQDDEQTSFGIRDERDSIDKGDRTSGDIWFGAKNGGTRGPAQSRSENNFGRRPDRLQPSSRNPDGNRAGLGNFSEMGSDPAKSSSGPNLKALLTPDAGNSSLKELFRPLPNGFGLDDSRAKGRERESVGLRSLDFQPRRSSPFGDSSLVSPSGPSSQPVGRSPMASPYSSSLDSRAGSVSSRLELAPPRSPVPTVNSSGNDMNRGSTRDLFAPPPRPGGLR